MTAGGSTRRIVRLAWYPLAALSLLIVAVAIPVAVAGEPIGVSQAHLRFEANPFFTAIRRLLLAIVIVSGLTSLSLALLVHRRLSQTQVGLFLSYYLLGFGVLVAGPIELLQPVWPSAPWVNSFLLLPIFTGPVTVYLFATFPSGRFVPRWSPWLILLSALTIPPIIAFVPERSEELNVSGSTGVVVALALLWTAILLGMLYSQIYRYRYVSSQAEKRQTRWVLYGLCLWLFVMLITSVGWTKALSLPPGSQAPSWLAFAELGWVLSSLFFPISLTIAILRHQLFDIDLIINRTLVYGALTACVILFYMAIVGAAGLFVQTNVRMTGVLVTLAIVAATFNPLRKKLQSLADRAIPISQTDNMMLDSYSASDVRRHRSSLSPGLSEHNLSGSLSRAARAAWYAAAALAVGIYLVSLPGYAASLTTAPISGGLSVAPGSAAYGFNILSAALSIGAAGLSLALAVLVFRRRSSDRMALFLSFYMLAHGVIVAGPIEFLEYLVPGIAQVSVTYLSPSVMGPASIALLATFPDGTFVPRWSKPVTYGSLLFVPLSLLIGEPDLSIPQDQLVTAAGYLVFFGTAAVMIYAQIHRHRRVSSPLQRQQTKWFVFGFVIWLSMAAVSSIPYMWLDSLPPGSPYPEWVPGMAGFWWLATAAVPVALTMAIMRSRLYEIDLIINRALVYGALTASVIAVYALVVGGLGVLFQASGNLVLSLLATGLVAVLFQPLRQRLQGGVNRLMFGEREDPVSVLSTLGRKLEETVSPDQVLQSIAETVAMSLKLPYVAVEFEGAQELETAAAYGRPAVSTEEYPISFQSERIGKLIVAPRAGQEELGAPDRLVLESIARQAGTAVQAAKLAADLQQSREDLIAAREEERRRLRRDLHDGLGPQLASQSLTLEALERRLKYDPDGAAELLENLKEQSRSAVHDIRRLVYDLRPPALDELGLVGAIEQLAATRKPPDLELRVSSSGELDSLPAAVEVAAYRIAQEAITNVLRHSEAKVCRVELAHRKRGDRDQLWLTIRDNGRGISPLERKGVGLYSMRERAEELGGELEISGAEGGGTVVAAVLPFPGGGS